MCGQEFHSSPQAERDTASANIEKEKCGEKWKIVHSSSFFSLSSEIRKISIFDDFFSPPLHFSSILSFLHGFLSFSFHFFLHAQHNVIGTLAAHSHTQNKYSESGLFVGRLLRS